MKLRQRALMSFMKTCMCCPEHSITNYRINHYVVLACQRTWRSEEARGNDKNHKLSPEEFLLNLHNSRINEQKNVSSIFKKHVKVSTTNKEQMSLEAEKTTQSLPHKVKESTLANVEELLSDNIDDDKSNVSDTNKNTMHECTSKFVTDQFNDVDKKDSWENFCNKTEYLAMEPFVSEEFTLPTIIEEKELENLVGSSEDDLYLQNILLDIQEGLNLQEANSITDNNTTNQSDDNIVNLDSKLISSELLYTSNNNIDSGNGAENVVINAAAAEDKQANTNASEQFTGSVDENSMNSIADTEINDEDDNEMESETRMETEELNDIEESDASETELIDEMLSSPLPSFTLDDLFQSLEQNKRSSDAHLQHSSTSTNFVAKISKDNKKTNNSYDDYIGQNVEDEFAKMSMTFDNQEVTSVEVNSLGEGLQSKNN